MNIELVMFLLFVYGLIQGIVVGYILWAPSSAFKQGLIDGLTFKFIWGQKNENMSKFKGRKLRNGSIETPPLNKVCSACNGSGYYDRRNSPKCQACNGTGLKVKNEY